MAQVTTTYESTRNYNFTTAQRVASGASSTQSSAVGCTEVLLVATAALWVAFGTNPTAVKDTAGNLFINAGEKFHLQIQDPSWKIAVIQDSATGALHIIPVG